MALGVWTSDIRHLNLATQLLYTFHRNNYFRFYGLAGISWHTNQREQQRKAPTLPNNDPNKIPPPTYEKYFSHQLFFGPGVGAELYLHRKFSLALEVPLVFSIEKVGESTPSLVERLGIDPGVNAAVHLYF